MVGITDAISMPSFQTIVPSLVEPDRIPAALALNATQFNLSRIVCPAIAGLLMAGLGAVGCFAVNAASYLPSFWLHCGFCRGGELQLPKMASTSIIHSMGSGKS